MVLKKRWICANTWIYRGWESTSKTRRKTGDSYKPKKVKSPVDFWKYFKPETPITKPQLLRIRGGKKKMSRIIYGIFHRDQAIPKSGHLPRSKVNLQWKETKFCWCVFLSPTFPHPRKVRFNPGSHSLLEQIVGERVRTKKSLPMFLRTFGYAQQFFVSNGTEPSLRLPGSHPRQIRLWLNSPVWMSWRKRAAHQHLANRSRTAQT